MRLFLLGWVFAGVAATVSTDASQLGLRIVTRETFPAGARETTTYISRDRIRVESRVSSPGKSEPHFYVHIRRCDLNRIFILNPHERTYLAGPLQARLGGLQRFALSLGRPRKEARGTPELVVETTTVDTGERRMAFGHSARRVLTTRRERSGESLPARETQIDGWYIDIDGRASCNFGEPALLIATSSLAHRGTNPPRVTFKNVGSTETGFPIDSEMTWRSGMDANNRSSSATRTSVTDLTWQPLDPGLFEIPSGFRSADGVLSRLADRYRETRYLLQTVVASWFE